MTTAQIEVQIDVLNAAYKKANWVFKLASHDYTANDKWYTMEPGKPSEKECKEALVTNFLNCKLKQVCAL